MADIAMMLETTQTLRGKGSNAILWAWAGWLCVFAAILAAAQGGTPRPGQGDGLRQLTVQEGRAIAIAAREHEPEVRGKPDCSHLVHTVYRLAGFEYPFASSQDLYAGADSFERVKTPQAGDLVTWPGHVGIVLDPVRHTFYSSVRSGMRAEFYDGPYWKARGKPRFYRYVTSRPPKMILAKSKSAPGVPTSSNERAAAEDAGSARLPIGPKLETIEEAATREDEDTPSHSDAIPAATKLPGSILIVEGFKKPTTEQASDGISKLTEEAGNVLRGDEPLRPRIPVVVVEQLKVERVGTKGVKGWADVRVDSRAFISGGQAIPKARNEKVRWELRRTESGWEALMPADRVYVQRDVAISALAARLAQLSQSDGAKTRDAQVVQEEEKLATLLHALLQHK